MRITSRGRVIGGIALIGSSALVLAGCGAAPTDNGSSTAGATDFLPCMVSDEGGFDDKSFNELGFNGLQDAGKDIGVTPITVQSDSETAYGPNIDNLVSQGCNLIVTVGFALSAATLAAAEANPDVEFAIIDDAADAVGAKNPDGTDTGDGVVDFPNVKPILFNTAQSAFLGGYAAASYSKSGIVATWGGRPFPTVSIFSDGFAQGVAYYNKQKGTSVQVLGYDPANPSAYTVTGGFEANEVAKTVAQNFIDQGADVVLPVGGPIYQSALAAITDSGKDVALVGVDSDFYESATDTRKVVLTSVLKGIREATKSVVEDAAKGTFSNDAYIGTLENKGVGLASFHDFESKVSPDLTKDLATIQKGIIDGSIPVTSYLGNS